MTPMACGLSTASRSRWQHRNNGLRSCYVQDPGYLCPNNALTPRLRALRKELIDPEIGAHRGRIVRIMGDGILVEFASAVDAVRCAVAVQRGATAAIDEPPELRIEFRVGFNVGDVLADGDDILGDSVNIAARLEGIAEPGGICLSAAAYEQVRGKLEIAVDDMGEQDLKNIARPLRTYRVVL